MEHDLRLLVNSMLLLYAVCLSTLLACGTLRTSRICDATLISPADESLQLSLAPSLPGR